MNTTTGRQVLAGLVATAVAIPASLFVATSANAADAATTELLQAMVAEEKVAHDVYVTLGDMYDVSTFDRIANSEDAARTLLDAYGVEDPTVGDEVGEFDDPVFQAMYDDVVAEGSTSLDAAAQVGITIEEVDIADLQDALDAGQPADIERVFTNLLNGSEKHLAAFTALANGDVAANGECDRTGQAQGKGQGQGQDKSKGKGNGQGQGRWA
jgi:hypothetical protein